MARTEAHIKVATAPVGANLTTLTTGQTTSFATGDDANVPYGREANFLTLSSNNPAGNTFRFTDTLLGQTFTSGVAIDWAYRDDVNSLVVGWQIGDNGSDVNWEDAINYCLSLILDTYTDWNLPNSNLIDTLKSTIYSRTLNYPPFSVTGNISFWSSSTLEGVLTTYAANLPNRLYGTLGAVSKTSSGGMRAKAYRVYTYAELGL